ncbi:hypothetical protein D3C85_1591760 [compost metagenome]
MKMEVHTGGKRLSGGLNEGLAKVGYHVFTEVKVRILPNAPAAKEMARLITKAMGLNFICLFFDKLNKIAAGLFDPGRR